MNISSNLLSFMYIPGHALNEISAKVVERHRDVHVLVLSITVVSTQQHDLIVILKVIVGDRDTVGAFNDIDKPIGAAGEVAMVDPDVLRAEDVDAIAVRLAAVTHMAGRAAHVAGTGRFAVVDVHAVDDDVADELHGEARAARDVHVGAPAVDGLEAVHDELALELDVHVVAEHDPQRLLLDHAPPQRARRRVHDVVVVRVRHHVHAPVLAPYGVLAEPQRAVRQPLPVALPPAVAAPTVVHWVARSASPQRAPRRVTRAVATANINYQPPVSKPKTETLKCSMLSKTVLFSPHYCKTHQNDILSTL
jgi:hypothetical protein